MSADDEAVGSVGEEAAKLLAALQEWARDSGSDYAKAAASSAATTASAINQHVATGAQECKYCPICRVVAAVRETSPEVKQHLTSAATSLVQALAAGMAAAGSRAPADDPPTTFERIDLDDDPRDDG